MLGFPDRLNLFGAPGSDRLRSVKPGETAHVTCHGLTLEGEGVARLDGREVLCPGLFPGEQAEVRIEALSRHHARAHASLRNLLTPHPARREPSCTEHTVRAGRCTGCALMAIGEDAQRELKRAMLRERYGLEVAKIEAAPRALGYRWSSKRVAFGESGRLFLGSFARGTHDPARMDGCLVDHPRITRAFADVAARANELGIDAYDERTRAGDLRYVWAKTDSEGVIITLITTREGSRSELELAPSLSAHGVLVSVQDAAGNVVRGREPTLVRGQGELTTHLLGQAVEVGALGFLQPNPEVAGAAYAALTSRAAGARGTLAFDLYAGAGVTTRLLRTAFREVVPCELYPESAALLGVPARSVEAFLTSWLADHPRLVPELIVANPPRKGMGPGVCDALGALGAPELRIMSCGPDGLAKDLAALRARGYTLEELRAFDTLPQTPHVELVARLVKC